MTIEKFKAASIIFCEDDEDDRLLFSEIVEEYNPLTRVELLSTGSALMELLNHFVPDLLFLDLDMPFKTGLECLLEIRKSTSLSGLPVIIFSSTSREANVQTAYETGAHLFLYKSPLFSEYAASLKSVLSLDWSRPDTIKKQQFVNGRYTPFG